MIVKLKKILTLSLIIFSMMFISILYVEANELTEVDLEELKTNKIWCIDADDNNCEYLRPPTRVGIGEASSYMKRYDLYRVPVSWDFVENAVGYLIKVVSPNGMVRYFRTRDICYEINRITGARGGTSISVATIGQYYISWFRHVNRFRTCSDCKPTINTLSSTEEPLQEE